MADVILHIFYGGLAFLGWNLLYRLVTTYRVPKDARRWAMELEEDLIGLTRAHLSVAMWRAGIARKMDHVPKEFEDPLMVVSELGMVAERALQMEMESIGMIQPRSWRVEAPLGTRAATCHDVLVPAQVITMIPEPSSVPSTPQLPERATFSIPPPSMPAAQTEQPLLIFRDGVWVPPRAPRTG